MNILHAIMTTTVLTPGLLLALGAEPATAMVTTAQLNIAELGGSVQDHGGGHYTTLLYGSGTLTNGVIVESTAYELTCAVDSTAETLECAGTLTVSGTSAPLRLRYANGQARYALHSGYGIPHVVAWERWFTDALVELVPPFVGGDDGDDGGDDGGDGGGGGGWNFPEEVVFGEVWTTRDYACDDWTVILDGAVISGLWW